MESGVEAPEEDEMMQYFICPITREIMDDPVVTPSMQRYERAAIEDWIRRNGTCPLTKERLRIDQLKPDFLVK